MYFDIIDTVKCLFFYSPKGVTMDTIKLSVRELVEFIYKSGDINVKAMSADRALEGIKAHKILQSQMGESYQKEFYL